MSELATGRSVKADADRMLPVNLSMSQRQRQKLHALGGSGWVRKQIDRAPWPKKETK